MSLPALSGAVEGPTDEPVLRRIIASRGALVHRVQVAQGKQNLQKKLPGYNAAARRSPWIVLVDLNGAYPCPRALADDWLPEPSLLMRLRVVVRSVEAWLLADRERFASTFAIPLPRVPADPDGLPHAKQSLLASVAHARRRDVREDMLPRPGSARSVGPAYTSRVVEDVANTAAGWRPEVAAMSSPSLASCLRRLDELISAAKP